MRNQNQVNAHRDAWEQNKRGSGALVLQGSFDSVLPHWYQRWLFPHRETRLMSEEATRSGLFIPYPLLAILMGLVMALGGGIIGLYSQLSAMNTTMIMRDSDYQRQVHDLQEKTAQLEVYIHNDREKLATMAAQLDKRRN